MTIKKFLNEIWNIAGANNVDIGVGKDMFLANIRNVHDSIDTFYHGADDVDYATLYEHYKELEDSVNDYNSAVLAHYNEIVNLRSESKFDEAVALLG